MKYLLFILTLLIMFVLIGCDNILAPFNSGSMPEYEPIEEELVLGQLPAFPGAEGFGAYTPGGRSGRVIAVTNLGDDGSGSLREAIEATGPRVIVFRISGTINLSRSLRIREPYVTIAGQTAPGDGICLAGAHLIIESHDVIVRYLRMRPGNDNQADAWDGISIRSSNVIIDHCSVSWSVDENISTSMSADMITVQNCINSEPLHHPVGPYSSYNGYGSLVSSNMPNSRISFHHNVFINCYMRSPRPQALENVNLVFDFRNNVIYNWGRKAGYNWEDPGQIRMNYVGNYLVAGPSTENNIREKAFDIGPGDIKIYQEGNIINGSNTGWDMFMDLEESNKEDESFAIQDVFEVETQSAYEAFSEMLDNAGAILPKRDEVDIRVINHIRSGSGDIINSQSAVGGWPNLVSDGPPLDSDSDGMPDDWEIEYGLDPNDDTDASNVDISSVGYTNIEVYINSLTGIDKEDI